MGTNQIDLGISLRNGLGNGSGIGLGNSCFVKLFFGLVQGMFWTIVYNSWILNQWSHITDPINTLNLPYIWFGNVLMYLRVIFPNLWALKGTTSWNHFLFMPNVFIRSYIQSRELAWVWAIIQTRVWARAQTMIHARVSAWV